ncbi:DUF4232 domain-containing protein [Streptomyces sp. NPDC090106]|uniref:DUF4232 domain-containing protein n=1 Tax=Streptomyces sp. NPDC090106 TaxID=3365946 RepID=UPI0038229E88
MRVLPLAATVLVAALTLTACSDDGDGAGDAGKTAKNEKAACSLGELTVQVGPANAAPAAGDSGNLPITLTNDSGAACTIEGLPSVTLGTTAVAADPSAKAGTTTLTKGATTSFAVSYVRGEQGGDGSLAVTEGTFGLPGSDETHGFTWSYGEIASKSDGKTPDASVTGFQQTGD